MKTTPSSSSSSPHPTERCDAVHPVGVELHAAGGPAHNQDVESGGRQEVTSVQPPVEFSLLVVNLDPNRTGRLPAGS